MLYQNIYKNLAPRIDNFNSLYTFSNSKTIYEIICLWKKENENIKIFITESRPANEGKILSKKLLKKNIEVIFTVDADLNRQIRQSDFVLIGADKILKDRSVINKIGSGASAIIARYYGKPFYVAASKKKTAENSDDFINESDPEDIWRSKAKNLKVFNRYFEKIERELITEIISD